MSVQICKGYGTRPVCTKPADTRGMCKACYSRFLRARDPAATRVRRNAQMKAWRDANPERLKQLQHESYARHAEQRRAYADANRKRDPEATKAKKRADYVVRDRWQDRLRDYGLTRDEYLILLAKQRNLCLCGKELTDRACADHCHQTGKVRGILCKSCNLHLGIYEKRKRPAGLVNPLFERYLEGTWVE